MAIRIAPEYPNVENLNTHEHLHAIQTAYKGLETANKDLHKLIKKIQTKYNISIQEIWEMWEGEKKEMYKLELANRFYLTSNLSQKERKQ